MSLEIARLRHRGHRLADELAAIKGRVGGVGLPERGPQDHVQRLLRPRPVLAHELRPARAQHRPQDEHDDDRVVELAGDRDEVGHEVDRHDEVAEQEPQQRLAPARDARRRAGGGTGRRSQGRSPASARAEELAPGEDEHATKRRRARGHRRREQQPIERRHSLRRLGAGRAWGAACAPAPSPWPRRSRLASRRRARAGPRDAADERRRALAQVVGGEHPRAGRPGADDLLEVDGRCPGVLGPSRPTAMPGEHALEHRDIVAQRAALLGGGVGSAPAARARRRARRPARAGSRPRPPPSGRPARPAARGARARPRRRRRTSRCRAGSPAARRPRAWRRPRAACCG